MSKVVQDTQNNSEGFMALGLYRAIHLSPHVISYYLTDLLPSDSTAMLRTLTLCILHEAPMSSL